MIDFFILFPPSLALILASLILLRRLPLGEPAQHLPKYSEARLAVKDIYSQLVTHSQESNIPEILDDLSAYMTQKLTDAERFTHRAGLVLEMRNFELKVQGLRDNVSALAKKKDDTKKRTKEKELESEFLSTLHDFLILEKKLMV
jgi:hypothetical protein